MFSNKITLLFERLEKKMSKLQFEILLKEIVVFVKEVIEKTEPNVPKLSIASIRQSMQLRADAPRITTAPPMKFALQFLMFEKEIRVVVDSRAKIDFQELKFKTNIGI